ncbi:MAG: D-alanyl-D-alanine carboxypeptidase/D-alanyl-D-alanine-endopeptidase [Deltaproteobacteria bacterium]|nr:MAG: D-alanyl-D-alanine carboxypeptidase/D-alanyl-D-alanine-endopeptidase [Deltaproteobacteria bacterium]
MGSTLRALSLLVTMLQAVVPGPPAPAGVPLTQALQAILHEPALRGTTLGIHVVRLRDGATLLDHHADALLVPASNVKMLTAAAALDVLGPDFTFDTKLYGVLSPDGTLASDLIVAGHGDPYLIPERLYQLATRLRALGVGRIDGDLVVDDSYFTGPRLQAGFEQDDTHSAYMAPAGALSASFNAMLVHVLPAARPGLAARLVLEPTSAYAPVEGVIQTVATGRSAMQVDIVERQGRDVVQISGRIRLHDRPRAYWRRINQPALYTGEILRTLLAQLGIDIRGTVRCGAPPPQPTALLYTHHSPRLAELVGPLNKYSNNFIAGQIANTMGAMRFGAPGSWEKGHRAMVDFLQAKLGLHPQSYLLGNASGLHEVNRFSAKQMTLLVQSMYHQPRLWPEFLGSLAVAGGVGTLQDRMVQGPATGVLRAKTGTLGGASALSGYVTDRDNEAYAFAMIVNGYRGIEGVWRAQDRLGTALAEHQQPVAAAATTPAGAIEGG